MPFREHLLLHFPHWKDVPRMGLLLPRIGYLLRRPLSLLPPRIPSLQFGCRSLPQGGISQKFWNWWSILWLAITSLLLHNLHLGWGINLCSILEFHPLTLPNFWSGICCFACNTFHVQYFFGACLEVVMWRFEWRKFCIGSLKVKLILACQEELNWDWPSMSRNRLLFIRIQTLHSRMQQKWIEMNDIICKTANGKPLGSVSQQKVYWRTRKCCPK